MVFNKVYGALLVLATMQPLVIRSIVYITPDLQNHSCDAQQPCYALSQHSEVTTRTYNLITTLSFIFLPFTPSVCPQPLYRIVLQQLLVISQEDLHLKVL